MRGERLELLVNKADNLNAGVSTILLSIKGSFLFFIEIKKIKNV